MGSLRPGGLAGGPKRSIDCKPFIGRDAVMSRIEEAIERAAKLRKLSEDSHEDGIRDEPVPERKMRGSGFEQLLLVDPLPVKNPLVVMAHQNNDAVCEEYKKLKSLIVKMSKGESFQNTLMITSTVREEGKSLTSLNLSLALAQSYDHTVLLIDADLRKPSIHEFLGLKPKVGLVQCLREEVPLDQALIKTGIGKLVFLPAGGTVSDPVELLSSNRMKYLISELKTRYPERFVVFDTPPAYPFADAQVLGSSVDGVIFVVRDGIAPLQHLKEAVASLKDVNLLGAVFNDANYSPPKNRYYSY